MGGKGKGKGPSGPPPAAAAGGGPPKAADGFIKRKSPEELVEKMRQDELKMTAKQTAADLHAKDSDEMGFDAESLAEQRALREATHVKCDLCGFGCPTEELTKHSVGHENCICEDWLYLGSKDNVNVKTMYRRGITHILNLANHLHTSDTDSTVMHLQCFSDDFRDKKAEVQGTDGEKLLNYSVRSFNWEDHAHWVENNLTLDDDPNFSLRSASKWIHEAKQANKKVIVHCSMGISRSTTVVIAYLMEYEGMTLRQGWDLCKERRYIVRPNNGLINKLGQLEVMLNGGSPTLTSEQIDAQEIAGGRLFAIGGNFDDYKDKKKRGVKKASWLACLPCCASP